MSAVLKFRRDADEPSGCTAPEIADAFLDRYGEEAPLQAALSARGAIEAGDVEACRLWRDVIDLLCARVPPLGRTH